jgi:hypothetical protein
VPSFHDSATVDAPPEEVWKLLYDPSRFPDWWTGIATVEVHDPDKYTMYPDGYPNFPMNQLLETHSDQQCVRVSCLVSDLRFEWRLEPADDGTLITVDVELPDTEAHRLDNQRETIQTSLRRLAQVASASQ